MTKIHYRKAAENIYVAYAEPSYRWGSIVLATGSTAAEAIGAVMLKIEHSVVDDDAEEAKEKAVEPMPIADLPESVHPKRKPVQESL